MEKTLAALFSPLKHEKIPNASAIIVPHAGYVFSGAAAAAAYAAVEIPDSVVILAFNHHGVGPEISLWGGDAWESPLGNVEIDIELRTELAKIENVTLETSSHEGEHSAEVQIPFLKFLNPAAKVNVFSVNLWPEESKEMDLLENFGAALVKVSRKFLVVCSTDMNHYEGHEETIRRGELVISALEKLDARGLVEKCNSVPITMCGRGPTVALLGLARAADADRFTKLAHTTSGPVSGDYDRTVGYLAGAFSSYQ